MVDAINRVSTKTHKNLNFDTPLHYGLLVSRVWQNIASALRFWLLVCGVNNV